MSIKSVQLQKFTVFEELKIEFSKGINVVIGTNGTGKTHLLKAMYGISIEVNEERKGSFDIASNYFSVPPSHLKKLKQYMARVEITLDNNITSAYEIPISGGTAEDKMIYGTGFKTKSIFIPAKEMLSHSKGFLSLYN